jgi:ankyrin repeat protein
MSFLKSLFGRGETSKVGIAKMEANQPPRTSVTKSIHEAASRGDLQTIKELLNCDDGLATSTDNRGNTALLLAASNGHTDVVQALLCSKADPNTKNDDGWTPLHTAVQKGHRSVAELLLAQKIEINTKNDHGMTALHIAAARNEKAMVELLLAKHADPNARNEERWTPLHLAVAGGGQDAAELLLPNNAEVNAVDAGGWTPLRYAKEKGHRDIVQLLQKHGGTEQSQLQPTARWNSKSGTLQMPDALRDALKKGEINKVEVLLRENADLVFSRESDDGQTPLHYLLAVLGDNSGKIAELLLRNKADVNAADKHGMTPLHLAAGAANKEVIEVLLNYGANVDSDATEKRGLTPIAVASHLGHSEVVGMLQAYKSRAKAGQNDSLPFPAAKEFNNREANN